MTTALQRRKGTATNHSSFTGLDAEITINTTNKSIHVHDGTTAGGYETLRADFANISDIATTIRFTDAGNIKFGTGSDDLTLGTNGTNGFLNSASDLLFQRAGQERLRLTGSGISLPQGGVSFENIAFADEKEIVFGTTNTNALRVGTFAWNGSGDCDGYIRTSNTNGDLNIGGKKLTLETGGINQADSYRTRLYILDGSITYDYSQTVKHYPGVTNTSINTYHNSSTVSEPFHFTFSAAHQYYSPTIGRIGQEGASNLGTLFISGAAKGIRFDSAGIVPCSSAGSSVDNSYDLGSASVRWDDIYATNNVIQTSDRNLKQDIEDISDAESRVAIRCKQLMKKYKFKDSVDEKGDGARIHFGIIAQDLQQAFTDEGLNAEDYAMFCSNTFWQSTVVVPSAVEEYKDEDGVMQTKVNEEYTKIKTYQSADDAPDDAVEVTRLAVRYNELFAFILATL
jgi:hypothetical protein